MTRDDVKALIVDALDRADTMGWRGRQHNHLAADLILRGLRAAGVKMRGPVNYNRNGAADFMKRLLARPSRQDDEQS